VSISPPSDDRVPWLAWDRHRDLVALGISAIGTAVAATPVIIAMHARFTPTTVILVAFVFWTFFAIAAMVLALVTFSRANSAQLKNWLTASTTGANRRRETAGTPRTRPTVAVQWAVLAAVSVAVISLNPVLTDSVLANALSVAVVTSAWAVGLVSYAVHYAREGVEHHGFEFPGENGGLFSDYLYLAAQVSTTFSSSDVNITTARARRVVTGHTLVSFCFGTVIIAVLLAVIFFSD
jgi:uncharacterized membrane protein